MPPLDESESTVPAKTSRSRAPRQVFAIGEVLNETYEIRAVIGEGGMGQVYEADAVHPQRSRARQAPGDGAPRARSTESAVTTDDDVETEIAELRRIYRAELPSKVATIANAVSARDRSVAAALAHRLRGTAGSYGFADVSAASGAIEDALASDEPDWSAVDAQVAELTAAAGR